MKIEGTKQELVKLLWDNLREVATVTKGKAKCIAILHESDILKLVDRLDEQTGPNLEVTNEVYESLDNLPTLQENTKFNKFKQDNDKRIT